MRMNESREGRGGRKTFRGSGNEEKDEAAGTMIYLIERVTERTKEVMILLSYLYTSPDLDKMVQLSFEETALHLSNEWPDESSCKSRRWS